MSDENQDSNSEINDPKAKFREAMEKKKMSLNVRAESPARNSKISGSQSGAGSARMFRRKSG